MNASLRSDRAPDASRFRDDVWTGLAQPQKTLPCKYFYDARGSALFEAICELPEYPLTRAERRIFNFRYGSAAHWIQVFRDYYGPMHKAFAALDADGQGALERDITALLTELNVGGVHSLVVPSEYLEIVVTKR